MFNAGYTNWQSCGAMEYFGQDEEVAGVAAGKKLAAAGEKNVLCVLQAQGQAQLEARCAGVKQGLGSEGTMSKLYVNGTDNSAVLSTMSAELTRNKNIDAVITLGAQFALIAIQAEAQSHATAKLYTFDTSAAEIAKIKSKQVQWAIDQQPYLQGYESVDALWLYLTNGNSLGGGQTVLTGPAFVDSSNVDAGGQVRPARHPLTFVPGSPAPRSSPAQKGKFSWLRQPKPRSPRRREPTSGSAASPRWRGCWPGPRPVPSRAPSSSTSSSSSSPRRSATRPRSPRCCTSPRPTA